MVAAAITPVPQPLAMPGAVTNNVITRTLVVSRPDTLGGYERHSWRRAHEELVSKPGLSCFVTVERGSGWFTGVRFRHGRQS